MPDHLQAASVRADLIRDAKSEILLSTHILKDDRAGMILLKTLQDAAKRGVKVTLLVDAWHNRVTAGILTELQLAGVRVLDYRPAKGRHLFHVLRRMHDKLFVVDREHLIIGDRNSEEIYYGMGKDPVVSKELYLQGEAAKDAASYFDALLKDGPVEKWQPKRITPADMVVAQQRLASAQTPRVLSRYSDWKKKLRDFGKVSFFHDPISTMKAARIPGTSVGDKLLRAIREAKTKIVIENPYVVLTREMQRALLEAKQRGVEIVLMTNSRAAADHKSVWLAWTASREFLAHIGAEIWEHPGNGGKAGAAMIHAKTVTIDDKKIFVMSFNLDPRSDLLNTEVAVEIDDPTLAAELEERWAQDRKSMNYVRIASDQQLLETVNFCQKLFRGLMRPIRGQL